MSRTIKKPYPKKFDARRFDHTCRNHGSCPWCANNRIFFDKKGRVAANEQLKEAKQEGLLDK